MVEAYCSRASAYRVAAPRPFHGSGKKTGKNDVAERLKRIREALKLKQSSSHLGKKSI